MSNPHGRPGNPAGYSGLADNLKALGGTIAEHARLRFQVLEIEGREAGAHYLKLIAFAVAALLFVLLAYLFLVAGGIFLLAEKTTWSWAGASAFVGLLHILLAAVCALYIRSRFKRPVFEATIQELKQDTEWLREKKNNS